MTEKRKIESPIAIVKRFLILSSQSRDGRFMVTGKNEDVEILGREFQVRTEITTGARPMVRSTVVHAGAVVASRESPIDPQITSETSLREQADAQHAQIIANLARRAAELENLKSNRGMSEPVPRAGSPLETATPEEPEEIPRPQIDSDQRLQTSVKVRQLIGPFSLALRPSPYHEPEAVRARLESAAEMVDQIMSAPAFPDIRLDEQVCFFDLKERTTAWRDGGRDPSVGADILLAMVAFAGHLRTINDRRELVEFDHKLLTWALFELDRNGVSQELLYHLRPLYGRDSDLDRLLDQPPSVTGEALLDVLNRLLDGTRPAKC